jgi:hypothetical protein
MGHTAQQARSSLDIAKRTYLEVRLREAAAAVIEAAFKTAHLYNALRTVQRILANHNKETNLMNRYSFLSCIFGRISLFLNGIATTQETNAVA